MQIKRYIVVKLYYNIFLCIKHFWNTESIVFDMKFLSQNIK